MDCQSLLTTNSEFKWIPFNDCFKLSNYKHNAHCVIYCKSSRKVIRKKYATIACVAMQVRFDGKLGFPGGRVIVEEGIVTGLNRELVEEINLTPELFMTQDNHLFSHQNDETKQFCHFYEKEVTMQQFEAMEKDILKAEEYGDETMGLLRVPLFTMDDGFRGFPAFLTNAFIGNARDQLLNLLIHSNLLTREYINESLKKANAALSDGPRIFSR